MIYMGTLKLSNSYITNIKRNIQNVILSPQSLNKILLQFYKGGNGDIEIQ